VSALRLLAPRLGAWLIACAVFCHGERVAAQSPAQSLPDWSGWWGHRVPLPDEWRSNPPPLRPAVVAARAANPADPAEVASRWCRPMSFTGSSGGFTEAVEFLFTPGRVTLTNEMGLIRRIYTDGRPLPRDPVPTNTGTSIGRWEGETLVVETVGINPAARYPGPQAGSVTIGENARISERIFLKDPTTLQFDIETIAPDVLTGPDRRTRLYSRLPKTMANEVTFCADYDRSIDPTTGRQRFDLTPPADLPPPPAR
jgi:hypothetical protein